MSSCPLATVVAELLDGQRHDGHVDALLRHPTPNPSRTPQVGPAARQRMRAKGWCGHRRAIEERDEFAPFQLINLHSTPTSRDRTSGYRIG